MSKYADREVSGFLLRSGYSLKQIIRVATQLRKEKTHKQALDDLGVTPAEAKAGVASLASLLLEESLFFVCGEDDTLANKIEQFLSKHRIQEKQNHVYEISKL